jgi:hypothetical protein
MLMRLLKTKESEKLKNEIIAYYSMEHSIETAYNKKLQFQSEIIRTQNEIIMTYPENSSISEYYEELLFNLNVSLDLMETLNGAYKKFLSLTS